MTLRTSLAALALAAAAAASSGIAHAAPPVYQGTLTSGSFAGSVAAESGPWATPERWSFWQFSADFLADVSFTVTPDDAMHDVFIAVWYGLETDTANYFDMTSGSVNTVFVAAADAVSPFAPDGAGAPAALSFTNVYGSGPFTLAVADYADGLGSGTFTYTVAAVVPEPGTAALWLAGLGLASVLGARRRAA